MKNIISLIVILSALSTYATAVEKLEAYCTLTINKIGKVPYVLNGMVRLNSGNDYLTLEPAISHGAKFSARVLLTNDNYHPVTIHPRGDTSEYTLFADLAQVDNVELEHEDKGFTYNLKCNTQLIPSPI